MQLTRTLKRLATGLASLALVAIAPFAVSPTLSQERSDFNTRCEFVEADTCPWGNMDGKTLDGKTLSDSNYMAAHARGTSLRGARLERVNFQVADVARANFSSAQLASATFFAANAENAQFVDADLRGANFTRANLRGANLKGARVDGLTLFISARLAGASWFDGRVCAEGSIGGCD